MGRTLIRTVLIAGWIPTLALMMGAKWTTGTVAAAQGHILLAEDTTGQGHISRAIGSGDRISLCIPLADGAVAAR